MARVHSSLVLFLAGASVFCAAGWTSRSFASWSSHAGEGPNEALGSSGTTVGAMAPFATPAGSNSPGGYSATGNGVPRSAAPSLAAPIGFDRSTKRVRELDVQDPWTSENRARIGVRRKLELEGTDPWNASLGRSARIAHPQLTLDESDPWSGSPGVAASAATKSSL